MTIEETPLRDLIVITPQIHGDDRGYFMETFVARDLENLGHIYNFVQDNEAMSSEEGVLRGLHYQCPPFGQAKLVRVVQGSVFDVAVDIRPESPTYGSYFGVELSAINKKQLLVPRGFAHGYLTLEPNTIFVYKCDNYYSKDAEAGIRWDDARLNIKWPIGSRKIVLSDKDRELPIWENHAQYK